MCMLQVCGSDGMTYDTDCHLKKSNCLNEKNVTVASFNPCSKKAFYFHFMMRNVSFIFCFKFMYSTSFYDIISL